jgi:putative DNA primase/helicase
MECLGVDFKGAVEAVESVIGKCKKGTIKAPPKYNASLLRGMYGASTPLNSACLGGLYLKNRGLNTFPPTLRYLDLCYEPSTKTKMPAILATFSAPDSEAITLHRIFLKEGGFKADLECCKMTMTPKREMAGGAVRLFPAKDVVGVAEGIETSIAAKELFDIPVWATLNTALMEKFEPPKGVAVVVIFADNDQNHAGQRSAHTLANRLYLRGYSVDVQAPENVGTDFLDQLVAKKGA